MKLEPGMAYNTKVLNKVFAVLSIVFMLSVVWMMLDDFIRPWKAYQVKAIQLKKEFLQKQLQNADKEINKKELEKIEKELEKAQIDAQQQNGKITELQKEVDHLNGPIKLWTIKNGQANSNVTALTFQAEMAQDQGKTNAKKLMEQLKDWKAKFKIISNTLKEYEQLQKAKKAEIDTLRKSVITLEKEIEEKTVKRERFKLAIEQIKINPVYVLRNSPFIDYLDPTIKIQQIVLKNYSDDRYFQKVTKVDRCTTCHTFIDSPGYENQANPFKTHPKLELMVGENSKHPMSKIGCTNCHGGEGHRVNDLASVAHIPQNEKQAHRWKEEYGWHEPHKVPVPMVKLQYAEGMCAKCHQGVERIPMADKLNHGRDLIQKYGCYACHKIDGWQHVRKPAPSLEKIASKVTKEFAKSWIWSPKQFNPHTKMPSFFNQSNNNTPEFKKRNIVEVNSIVEVLWDRAAEYQPTHQYKSGDVEKGKQLISEIGCLGCHQVDGLDENYMRADNTRGPYLKGLGSKVSGDWLVSWLKNPQHFDPNTIMPSLRLDDEEANNIAAFLLNSKDAKFERLKFDEIDNKTRDQLLLENFSIFDTQEKAQKTLDALSERERTLKLGEISIGKYGCYSCHNIKGFDGFPPIGPELTAEGSKPVDRFGFGHEHIAHERDVWIKHHLENPRRWDAGTTKEFKDLLRMPKFDLTKEEIESITLVLLGQVDEKIAMEGKKNLSAEEQFVERGQRVLRDKNCYGCHKVDGYGGIITKNYEEDLSAGPPFLVEEGHRIKPNWLHSFLDNVKPIRPWLKIRMPSFHFTNEERNLVVNYFQVKGKQLAFDDERSYMVWEDGERDAAIKLFKTIDCTICHTQGFKTENPMAPDLRLAANRLRASWIEKWISAPSAILPYTTMPSFWDGQNPAPDILGGDKNKQIRALTKYIFELTHEHGKGTEANDLKLEKH